jgi:hypothetical protein
MPTQPSTAASDLAKQRWKKLTPDQRRAQTAPGRAAAVAVKQAKREKAYWDLVQRIADEAGPLTPDQRDKIALILKGSTR